MFTSFSQQTLYMNHRIRDDVRIEIIDSNYLYRGIKMTKLGRRVLGAGLITGLALSIYLGYEASKDEPLPQPEKTGVMVNIYPQQGEGERLPHARVSS